MPARLAKICETLEGNMRQPSEQKSAARPFEIWVPRGGDGKTSGAGPSGWKLRPAKVLARKLAEAAANFKAGRKSRS